jgi:hypothetical protein
MRTLLLLSISLMFVIHPVMAQDDSIKSMVSYRTWITPLAKARAGRPWGPPAPRSPVLQGTLIEVKDSSLMILETYGGADRYSNDFDLTKVDARNIDVVKIRKKGSQGTGILIGALSGLAVAGVMDIIIYSNWKKVEGANDLEEGLNYIFVQTPQFIAVIAGSIGIIGTGIGIGAAVGSASVKIPIKGSQKVFDRNKNTLNDYAIKPFGGRSFTKLKDTIADIDGNIYHTIALGGQVWMAENLKAKHYSDGSDITVSGDSAYGTIGQYGWSEASHSSKLCPARWHVPSIKEWTSLFNSLGGIDVAGKTFEKDFSPADKVSQWWSATELDNTQAQSVYLNNVSVGVMYANAPKSTGLSVRCIRDY